LSLFNDLEQTSSDNIDQTDVDSGEDSDKVNFVGFFSGSFDGFIYFILDAA
jgi:hypothetical protein